MAEGDNKKHLLLFITIHVRYDVCFLVYPEIMPKTTSKSLLSIEKDYEHACKTKDSKILEQYFSSLSDAHHLKQLCNSVNIRKPNNKKTRITALAEALLRR